MKNNDLKTVRYLVYAIVQCTWILLQTPSSTYINKSIYEATPICLVVFTPQISGGSTNVVHAYTPWYYTVRISENNVNN